MTQTKYTDGSGVSEIWANTKNYIAAQLLGKSNVGHTHSASDITSGLATVATSGSYNDLSNKPTIPTVNNATLTIQKNGSTVKTFTANASSNVTANITVPTKTSDLTNDSHVSITTETDTTSTGTPAHGGTFTCIDSVTRDSNGHVTKVNTKTVTLPTDSNTDTLVTQNVSTANENHPILLSVTKDATTNQGAKTSIFASGVKVNPSTNTVTATTFSGALSGNASSATQFSANKAVTLTGDVTGTASSKAGWSVATTLANSGVTAGTYGPGADVTGNNNATISIPEITVDAKGRVTSVTNRTLTCKNNTYNVYNKTLTIQKNGTNVATFTSNSNTNVTANITVPTKTSELTNDSGFLTSHQDLSGYVPVTGGAVMTGKTLGRTVDTDRFDIYGGKGWEHGGGVILCGASYSDDASAGLVKFYAYKNSSNKKNMLLFPNGTWTWDGTAVQLTSDKRLKQQITQIDNALLDAWEDVDLVQFKYNDAVEEKGTKARLHTGYVVQQIDKACKEHGVDISAYGLYCHEEYPEETEEVEVTQDGGTKVKETKVIREASEHYSLRYTEVYAVECMYLRRCIARLTARIEELEKGNNTK